MNFDNLTDIDDEFDVLDELEDLFEELSVDGPTNEQLNKMYATFLDDIVRKPLIIKGIKLSSNRKKSRHPVCRGKSQGFEHIITRESKHNKRRYFDNQRANKIHWIKPIIENVNDPRIKYFEAVNDKGFNQLFYWYEEKNFIVIVREINPQLMLITSFSVDTQSKNKYKDAYWKYKE
ncbi:hypothetical protein [Tenacibaculum insulae]|uniref:hypothetical protein n=1 Tax=Tenacibaculum insulae TaxID=2029677 RepID=UPI003AB83499